MGISRGNVGIKGTKHLSLDLMDTTQLNRVISEFKPDIIIHTAALVNVELCESQPDLAVQMNIELTKNIVHAAHKAKAFLIHISTDAFYLSSPNILAKENDLLALHSQYAITKWEAEKYALAYDRSIVLRTNFYGYNLLDKASFGEWILRDLQAGKTLTMATDVSLSPILVNELVNVLERIISFRITGIYNGGCTGSISKYDFAKCLQNVLEIPTGKIIPVSVENLAFSAWRSNNMGMENRKLTDELGIPIPSAEECIEFFCQLYKDNYRLKLKGAMTIEN